MRGYTNMPIDNNVCVVVYGKGYSIDVFNANDVHKKFRHCGV